MDYEKRYNEALNDMRAIYPNLKGDAKLAAEHAFPELRESEGERIRKAICHVLNNADYRVIDQTDYTVSEMEAYLEKQKEGEKEVSDLFDSTDSYNKGFRAGQEKSLQELKEHIKEDKTQCYAYDAGYAAGFIVGKKQGWKEHKAFVKENSKTADSIPSDCVSNAKCEDRWHKVGDFLPDSGRDVLAKDALGNYLLASFDGDQWFVNVYDGEDKPIVYTPAIKEWCDIPSGTYKETLHVPETCKENADSFTDACKDVIVATEKYLDWLTGYPDYAPKGKYSLRDMLYCLSILEKQKEPENVSATTMAPSCWAEEPSLQKEQKPASTEDMPYITDEHFFEREHADSFKYKLAEYMTKNCRKEESPDGYTYHISAETILKMAEEELLKRGVVQKPAECLKAERDGWYVCIKDYYRGGKKQCSVGDLVQAKGGMYMMGEEDISEWFRRAYYEEVRNAFEPNTDTNIPVELSEWSEEDENTINLMIAILRENHPNGLFKTNPVGTTCMSAISTDMLIKRIESLRHQSQGIYKQVIHTIFGMLKDKDFYEIQPSHRVSLLNDIRVKCKDAIDCAPILDEPSWKPSEEQMNALNFAITYFMHETSYKNPTELRDLYEDLLKLKGGVAPMRDIDE